MQITFKKNIKRFAHSICMTKECMYSCRTAHFTNNVGTKLKFFIWLYFSLLWNIVLKIQKDCLLVVIVTTLAKLTSFDIFKNCSNSPFRRYRNHNKTHTSTALPPLHVDKWCCSRPLLPPQRHIYYRFEIYEP